LRRAARLPEGARVEAFDRIEEVDSPQEAHASLMDAPVSFGDGRSSGPDVRHFAVRHVRREPARGNGSVEDPEASDFSANRQSTI
jgi:hypothetical protein